MTPQELLTGESKLFFLISPMIDLYARRNRTRRWERLQIVTRVNFFNYELMTMHFAKKKIYH